MSDEWPAATVEVDGQEVPEQTGEGEDWDQGGAAMKEGYAAFLSDKDAYTNPYQQSGGAGSKGWSGYKKRKLKLWDAGFILAAIAEGEFESSEEVAGEYDVTRQGLPREPRKAIYEDRPDTKVHEDIGEYAYYARSVGLFDTRRDAIGEAATDRSSLGRHDPLQKAKWVDTYVRTRRPQLPPLETEGSDE